MMKTNNFRTAIEALEQRFTDKTVHTDKWQGVDIKQKPEMAMHEVLHASFETIVPTFDLDYYRKDIAPNLPWADDHFLERVCGQPLNPGHEWQNWPYARSAATFRGPDGKFNHNYMERYWPRFARMPDDAQSAHYGINGEYGDLDDVIRLLNEDPLTRQAYLPIFFPEDTGNRNPGRKPCTLGYQFIMRAGYLDVTYYIRSCDFTRHFRDDLYLTVRLLLWVIQTLQELNPTVWGDVFPGKFIFHCTSLHMFRNDYLMLKRQRKNEQNNKRPTL